jgi:D-sedoheptulose 7-phosphate isomerase
MTKYRNRIDDYFSRIIRTLNGIDRNALGEVVDACLEVYRNGKTIFVFGNGGSGATASHIYCDLAKGVSHPLEKRLRVICLNDNIPAMMAYANDISWEDIFVEPMKNLIQQGDLAIGISGSGNSPNVVKALTHAKNIGATTVAWCGYDGGKIHRMADISVHADINDMEVAEDVHLILNHALKNCLMDELWDPTWERC